MSKQTSYILGILGTILIGTLLYSKFCCNGCCEKTKKVVPLTKENKSFTNTFSLTTEGFEYSCNSNFNFITDSFNLIKPSDKCLDEGILKLNSFFKKNSNSRLKITGYCLSTEKNSSAFPNLGYARANDVKNYFVSKGVTPNRFEITGKIEDNLSNENGTITGAISYVVSNDILNAKGEDFNALKEKITANPLILYFNSNQIEINLTDDERQKVADLAHYLDNIPSAKISCIGHTDSVGDRNVNIQLGQERSNFAKEYLSKNGISDTRIEATSKGPDEPIADNLTPEGKSKNRRTVVTLK